MQRAISRTGAATYKLMEPHLTKHASHFFQQEPFTLLLTTFTNLKCGKIARIGTHGLRLTLDYKAGVYCYIIP